MWRSHLVGVVERVIHEAGNHGGLADVLVAEEDQLVLCHRRNLHRGGGAWGNQVRASGGGDVGQRAGR